MLPFRPLQKLLSWTMNRHEEELRAVGKRVLVAGLGNHGLCGTRHSVGMAVLNHLATKLSMADQWRKDKRCCADVVFTSLGEVELVLMKPRSFMNINGRCVVSAAEIFNLGAEDIYLVHDDLDKSLGKVALKLGGSARGHNGVRSCIKSLKSDRMVRLRIGIGRPVGEAAVEHYVLGKFTRAEQEILPQVFEQAVTMLLGHIQQRNSSPGTRITSGSPAKTPLGMEGA